ncbi:MAG: MarR family winged helix-turn-helix transcriptional regulator [Hyphomonadaceae bacterium]|nr:MarR family winged helix-turn-helix transcriptional regulator [Hyphomonadaceae bacterium]
MQQQSRASQVSLPKEPVQRAWVALQRFGPALLDRVETELKAAGFPALEWYDVLWAIEREGPLRQRDLAGHMLIARYSISRLVDRMEEDGVVTRRECPEDGRGQMVHATPAGLNLRKAMWSVYGKAMREALAPLSEKEKLQLTAILTKLA